MAFALTKYIFPIEKGKILSASMSYQFDNPRTPEEIALVKNHIGKIVNLYDQYQKKGLSAISARYNLAIAKFLTKANVHKNPPYYIGYFQNNMDKPVLDILSEIWLIVRFADKNEFEEFINKRESMYYNIAGDIENSYTQSFNNLLSYCHIISLLTNTRNPDTNRFNVEESISKQFKLKCGVLIYIQNPKIELSTISKELSNIYKQRSDIAHGDYKEDFKMESVI